MRSIRLLLHEAPQSPKLRTAAGPKRFGQSAEDPYLPKTGTQ
jgi:hypothetical protein